MKGQIFLIISIIVSITLIILKSNLNIKSILEAKRFLEIGIERKEFENLRNEFLKLTQINSSKDMEEKTEDFLRFLRNSYDSRLMEFRGILINFYYSNPYLNFSFFNGIGSTIKLINISLENQYFEKRNLADLSKFKGSFNIQIDQKDFKNVVVYYEYLDKNSTEIFNITLDPSKITYFGFYHIFLSSERTNLNDKIKVEWIF